MGIKEILCKKVKRGTYIRSFTLFFLMYVDGFYVCFDGYFEKSVQSNNSFFTPPNLFPTFFLFLVFFLLFFGELHDCPVVFFIGSLQGEVVGSCHLLQRWHIIDEEA